MRHVYLVKNTGGPVTQHEARLLAQTVNSIPNKFDTVQSESPGLAYHQGVVQLRAAMEPRMARGVTCQEPAGQTP